MHHRPDFLQGRPPCVDNRPESDAGKKAIDLQVNHQRARDANREKTDSQQMQRQEWKNLFHGRFPLTGVVLNAGCFALENLIAASEV